MEVHNATLLGHVGITNDHLEPLLNSPITEFLTSLSLSQGAILFLCLFWGYSSLQVHRRVKVPGAPVHGYWSWFEPTWFLQLRYAKDAHKIIASGYEKVRLSHHINLVPLRSYLHPAVQQERQAFRTASPRSRRYSPPNQVHFRAANNPKCTA